MPVTGLCVEQLFFIHFDTKFSDAKFLTHSLLNNLKALRYKNFATNHPFVKNES